MSPSRIPVAGLLGARLAPSTSPALGLRFLSHSAQRPALHLRPVLPVATSLARRHLSSETSEAAVPEDTRPQSSVKVWQKGVALPIQDGKGSIVVSPLWLRDCCTCSQCVDPDSGQKNFATTELPNKPKISHIEMSSDGAVVVEWENDIMAGGEGNHTSRYSAGQLMTLYSGRRDLSGVSVTPTLWNQAKYKSIMDKCVVSYDNWLNNDDAYYAAFEKLAETGLIFVKNVPRSETEVEKIANRIGMLQHTFYGHTWDVRSKPRAENVAYTSKFLGLHQDLMYHEPIPKLQLLHCLENNCEGGESLFSDGIRAAYDLKLNQPYNYQHLVKLNVPFHYDKGGHHYWAYLPTIRDQGGLVSQTHWAPPFQGFFGVQKQPSWYTKRERFHYSMEVWHKAAQAFQRSIEAPENVLEVKLQPGECVIFDNTRLLHGRRQFAATDGQRWLKGTYISPQVYAAAEQRLKDIMGYPRDSPDITERVGHREDQVRQLGVFR
ncbi:hypothetical protein B0T14DRAFT_441523 [Immersiella caudata]|uniref:Gamma-butyrobetaine dioxygenase n=1 Tax=Immersiella caudata TaxID=314043 RepID=A0AA39TN90_9PEZI|nr:hypothetical protein B0T14DRAFT_441523 [Immersiella caudata]